MRIKNRRIAGLLGNPFTELAHSQLHQLMQGSRNRILGFGLVEQPAAQRQIGLDQGFQGLVRIVVNQALQPLTAFGNRSGNNKNQGFMLPKKLFFDKDVGMGNLVGSQLAQPFVITPLIQEFAVKGTGNRLFSLFAATLRTNVRPQTWAMPLGSTSRADVALFRHPF